MSVNRIVIVGRLVADPIVKTFEDTGKKIANVRIAVDRRVSKDSEGPKSDFFNVVVYGPSANFVETYLKKGRQVAIEGRLQSRQYADPNAADKKITVVEIIADNVDALGSPTEGAANGDGAPATARATAASRAGDEGDPFGDN